jgi:hypothetical protein
MEVGHGEAGVNWSHTGCTVELSSHLPEDKKQAEKLARVRAMGRAYFGVQSTDNDVGSKAEWYQEALGKVPNATVNKTSYRAHAT